ncbi:hypothetical protein CC86DRAFT_464072 [Ophiobolus disseminans]|uniref:Small ribosomal subunit protein mS35 mitochondrial conserved domain-containing protein n=1 Tax=Ophiobolus disseminans TaxID=1469910 RepID=A0A6A7AC22_9PLEO|nr:hypothetical protein CC86DRAFT_464072 [Ophiobolus disseminans]
MASLPRRLLLQSRQCPSRIRSRATQKHTTQWQRPISTTPQLRARDDKREGSAVAPEAKPRAPIELSPEDTAAALARLVADLKALDPTVVSDEQRKGKRGHPFATDMQLENDEDFEIEEDDKRKVAAGFWAEGEESMGQDEDFFGDDITSHGHGELDQHREMRGYNRLIAWEMPLLNQLARPFTPPTAATPFRFRYTSYMGVSHPAANKVVVEFSPSDLSLTPVSRAKLIKLSGPRYNPSTDIIKMACEKFDTQAQNKRFLGQTIEALVKEAKDMKDNFEDVPFDFRHHKPKKFHVFPKEWELTPERKQYLDSKRQEKAKLDDEKLYNGQLIDGKTVIDTSLPFLGAGEQALAEPVMVGGARGKTLR